MQTIRSVQYLRAAAALAVVVFHATEPSGRAFVVGAAGVDVFFIISGFILWRIARHSVASPMDFVVVRILRIAPAYWIVTLLIVAASQGVAGSFPHLRPEPIHVILSLFFVPHIDPQGQVYPLLVAGWTLNFEMFFYVLLAACLPMPLRMRPWLLVGLLLGLATLGGLVRPTGAVGQSITSPLLVEFVAGIALAEMHARNWLLPVSVGGVAFALGLCVFIAQALNPTLPDDIRLFAWGAPAVLLVAGAICMERHGVIPKVASLLALGDASYAIYLVHGLVISGLSRARLPLPLTAFVVVCVFVSIAVGLLFARTVEQPATRLLRQLIAAPRTRSGVGTISDLN